MDNAVTEEAKHYSVVKYVKLSKISTQKTESDTKTKAPTLRCDRVIISNFLSKAGKVYNLAKVDKNVKLELSRGALKSDLIFISFCCSNGRRTMK